MGSERIVYLRQEDDFLITRFEPPILDRYLFQATSSAFALHKVTRDPDRYKRIRAVRYEIGDPGQFDANVAKLQDEIESATSYIVLNEAVGSEASIPRQSAA